MKTLMVLLLAVVLSCKCYSQINEEKLLYLQKVEKYRKMKSTGKLLTLTGTAVAVVGLITVANTTTTTTYNSSGQQTSSSGNAAGGAVAWLVGNAMVGIGVPFWIVGGVSHGKYQRKLDAVSFKLKSEPQGMGLALTYKF